MEKNRTIIFVNSSFRYCGVDEYTLALIRLFHENHRIIVCLRKNSDFEKQIDGFTNDSSLSGKSGNRFYLKKNSIFNFFAFFVSLFAMNPDILHIQTGGDYVLAFFGKLYSLFSGKELRIIITRHNTYFMNRFPNHFFLKQCHVIIAVSDSVKRNLLNQFPDLERKITVIHNTNFREEIRDIETVSFQENGKFILGYLGRITYNKGIELFIESLRCFFEENPQLKAKILIHIGGNFDTPEYGEKIREFILLRNLEKNIRICGFVSDKESFFKGIDLLIVPSLFQCAEAFGLGVVESYSYGKPVIVLASGALPDLVEEGATGFIAHTENPADLAGILKKFYREIFNKPELYRKMREKCLFYYKNQFSLNHFKKEMEYIYFTELFLKNI